MKPNKLRGCSTWRHFLCIHTDITSCVYRAYKDSPNDWSLAEKLSECFWTLWGFTAEQEGIIIHSIKRKADYIYIISDPVHHEYLLLLFGWFIITVLIHPISTVLLFTLLYVSPNPIFSSYSNWHQTWQQSCKHESYRLLL